MAKVDLEIQKKALEFREKIGFGSTEPLKLKSILLQLDVLTVFKPVSSTFSGMAVKVNDKRYILVNSSQNLGRQHFTLAHELYHLFMQDNFTSRRCKVGIFDKQEDPEEYNADLFAAHLLLPIEGIIKLVPTEELRKDKITLSTVIKLEQYFGVSRSALLYRLKNLGYITSTKYNEYCKDVKLSALQHGYDTALYSPGNHNFVVGDYGDMAKHLYDADLISEGHYTSLMSDINIDLLTESTDNGEA